MKTILILLLAVSGLFAQTRKKQTTEYLTISNYAINNVIQKPFKVGYLAYTPDSYYLTTKKYPLIITCHGNGQKGTLKPDLLRTSFLPNKLDAGLKCEFVVISPQTNGYKPKWGEKTFYKELLDSITTKYRINVDSIFIMGYSGGGEGVCTYIKAGLPLIGVATFAPVITLTPEEKCLLIGKKVATYHCLDDKTISANITRNLIKHINNCEQRDIDAPLLNTFYATGGHAPWKKGLASDTLFNYFLGK